MSWRIRAYNYHNCFICEAKGRCEDDCSAPFKVRRWRRRYRIWNAIIRVEFT